MLGQFENVIHSVLDSSGMDVTNAFFDNTTVRGTAVDWKQFQEALLKVMRMLEMFGGKLNFFNHKFLVNNIAILGFELCKQGYMLW